VGRTGRSSRAPPGSWQPLRRIASPSWISL
jgi:hypothetical protein